MIEVGKVKAIYRYPVKGMRGEPLEQARLGWYGIEGDRQYAVIRPDDAQHDRPWLTGRLKAQLIQYTPRYEQEQWSRDATVQVTTPAGNLLPLDSPELRSEMEALFGKPVGLLKLVIGCFDALPVSLISENTVRSIGEGVGMALDPRRFRPNLLVEGFGEAVSPEDGWLGKQLVFGEGQDAARVRLHRQNVRCVMTTLDPNTAQSAPQVLKHIVKARDEKAGVYGSTDQVGTIKVGDVIRLAE